MLSTDPPELVAHVALRMAKEEPDRLARRLAELRQEEANLRKRLRTVEGAVVLIQVAQRIAAGGWTW